MEATSLLIFFGAVSVRLILLVYGTFHDRSHLLKYTDVDYSVFDDAAKNILQGESPYSRTTYRYTPLMALLVLPNHLLHPSFGKLLFVVCDILVSIVQLLILKKFYRFHSERLQLAVSLWLFNPLTIGISTRGSADSLMAVQVVACLLLLLTNRCFLAGVLFGLAVHFKIYPIIFLPSIYFYLTNQAHFSSWWDFFPRRKHWSFGFGALASFSFFTILFYSIYGREFIQHTYLYHITRRDTRHNFALSFYMLYLDSLSPSPGQQLILQLPQLLLMLLASWRLRGDLSFTWFFLTHLFVSWNKVQTSQYFVWYLSLLPLAMPALGSLSVRRGLGLVTLWAVSQAVWLGAAYLLEFRGLPVFEFVWAASLAFFLTNLHISCALLRYKSQAWRPA